MPNGECPIGAQVLAQNEAQGRELGDIKARLSKTEKSVEGLTVKSAVQAWKIGVVIGLIVLVLGSLGNTVLSPIMAAMINGGG